MHDVRTADGLGGRLGQSEVCHFPRVAQLLHGSGDILDRDVRVDPVLIEEIDALGLQARQHGVHDFADVFRATIETAGALAGLRVDVPAELRRNHHAVSDRRERLADECFVRKRSVRLGGVEEGDAAIESRANEIDRRRPGSGLTVEG